MPTEIKGQPTSSEVMDELRSLGKPVLLAFSCGKDSVAAFLAMRDAGIEVVPAYLYTVPNLGFVIDELDYFEDVLGTQIHYYPHAAFFRFIRDGVAQAPERASLIEGMAIPKLSYDDIWNKVREDLGLVGCYVADGVRAADSLQRRAHFVTHGVIDRARLKVSPIADWLKSEVMGRISEEGIELPIDYELFGRTFDGLDYRFIEPMRERLPDDYAVLETWFPMLEADIVRNEIYFKG